ncbi:MAG: CRISPR-associated endonuclease Cas6 [candidate division KSB1 bacterium]|nr:CRISPR-associated endonuclease Cas6 [candidate division KSB1 bacterium]MDZ7274617.1 CRISPR-associated endonuclease Cas6 [candidate division KSB1 bacterium]MDZ7285442.1 CRISPR-associated endonuclease Cas6 [candidate division KSB1 bacterium]MDZ7298474.1 CRISPR-associated endonuclease Cas6 [candidate division KSB1 bacterium]MDZ7306958.1 CRISPR-associated endonuclease Cas6 [candidate division KSB1 bacterium]
MMVAPVIPYLRWELLPAAPGPFQAHQLRGAIANLYREWSIMHQHHGRQYLYRHPLVQYKVIDGLPMVVGLGVGAELLAALDPPRRLLLGTRMVEFSEVRLVSDIYEPDFSTLHRFYFATPWLALNEDNYDRYREHELHERHQAIRELLERILIGNILSFAKGLGLSILSRLQASIAQWYAEPVRAKQRQSGLLAGFAASGEVTFSAPAFWGFGKQSSRGNGVMMTAKAE